MAAASDKIRGVLVLSIVNYRSMVYPDLKLLYPDLKLVYPTDMYYIWI